ncbi:MAG: aspartate carbamoyltransferase [Clostridia bacterium]|nr:aspartate carbamoyltransferase [Clostridia bacterium]MBR1686752.1 aspartate carbamoyltransferase [Clostridia bacterium]
MRHLIDILDLSLSEIDSLIRTAEDIIAHPQDYAEKCRGQILASLFYESSTRTRLSFESAMCSLGGSVIGFADAETSSASKGESLQDTIKVVSGYADIIAMRHPRDGAALAAALYADVPVINAGDGSHNHPTQTLTDLLTIHREKGKISGMTVGLCGDLRYGRTVHSLIEALSRYPNMRFIFIAPEELRMPEYVLEMLETLGQPYVETDDLDSVLPELDILYMTRIQRERFEDSLTYERLKNSYILTRDRIQGAKPDMAIMHPLPRVNEIAPDVDEDPRAAYFRQTKNGRYIRMALILKLLSERAGNFQLIPGDAAQAGYRPCPNGRCITRSEMQIKPYIRRGRTSQEPARCLYCDTKLKY